MSRWTKWLGVNERQIIATCLLIDVVLSLCTLVLWVGCGPKYAVGFLVSVVISLLVVCLFDKVVS
jgi:hypothetical protein